MGGLEQKKSTTISFGVKGTCFNGAVVTDGRWDSIAVMEGEKTNSICKAFSSVARIWRTCVSLSVFFGES